MKFSRAPLAAVLASVFMPAAPSFGQSPNVAAKPSASDPKIAQTTAKSTSDKPTVLEQAWDYAKVNPVVVIMIAKGSKDDITGEKIGDTLTAIMKQKFDVPVKYFVVPGADYTAVEY